MSSRANVGRATLSAVLPTMTTIKLVHSTARIFQRRAKTVGIDLDRCGVGAGLLSCAHASSLQNATRPYRRISESDNRISPVGNASHALDIAVIPLRFGSDE